jgi:electron transfer flavoprotein beta subunit
MKAKKKPVQTITSADLEGFAGLDRAPSEILALEPPPARQACRFVEGEPEEMARELVRLLREESKVV